MTELNTDNALWNFALKYYGAAGIASELIELQDKYGLKVNFLIFAVWLASINHRMKSTPNLRQAEYWNKNISSSIRRIRREVKHKLQALEPEEKEVKTLLAESYKKLLEAELSAEKVELQFLYDQLSDVAEPLPLQDSPKSLILENLNRYLVCESVEDQTSLTAKLEQLTSDSLSFFNKDREDTAN